MTASGPAQVFADRIGRIEVLATMAVAAEAAKVRAQGANLVDFGVGEPHFPRRAISRTQPSPLPIQ
jgi:aspartate aminotransferase